MGKKGFTSSIVVLSVSLITALFITIYYMPIVNSAASVKYGGERFLSSIEERNAVERIHAVLFENPSQSEEINYEDLNIKVEFMTYTINLIRENKVVHTIKTK